MTTAEQIRVVLVAAREEGLPFETGWYRALRSRQPPARAAARIVAEHEEDTILLRELKPQFRAAYERRLPTERELRVGLDLAERRLRDLIVPDEPLEIARSV